MTNNPWDLLMSFILDLKERLKDDAPSLGAKFEKLLNEIVVLAKECGYKHVGDSLRAAEKAVKLTRFLEKNMEAIANIDRRYNPYIENCNVCKIASSEVFEKELQRVNPHLYGVYREKKKVALDRMPELPPELTRTTLTEAALHEIASQYIDRYRKKETGGYKPNYLLSTKNPLTEDIASNNYYVFENRVFIRISLEPYRLIGAIDTQRGEFYVSDITRRKTDGWERYKFVDRKALPIHKELVDHALSNAMFRNQNTFIDNEGHVKIKPYEPSIEDETADAVEYNRAQRYINYLYQTMTTYKQCGLKIDLMKDRFVVTVGIDESGEISPLSKKTCYIERYHYRYVNASNPFNLWKVDKIIDYGVVTFDGQNFPMVTFADTLKPDDASNVVLKLIK